MSLLSTAFANRALIWRMARHELVGRYRGSLLGLGWAVLLPLFTIAIYAFVFGTIFRARWTQPDGQTEQVPFALLLFSGFILFNLLSEAISRAPTLMIAHQVYIKKMLFPLDVLPLVALVGAIINALIALGIFMIIYVVLLGMPSITILLLPMAFLPVVLIALAALYLLSSLGVFLRDINQVIPLVNTALLFLSPIFFPINAIPESFRLLIYLNPLTLPVNNMRDLLFWDQVPNLTLWGIYTLATAVLALASHWWFMRTRKAFADVL